MNKERYVSYEIAKLLKEKGFDWEVFTFYDEIRKFNRANTVYNWNNANFDVDVFSAPTLQMAACWLREVHKIDISVIPDDASWWIKITELKSWSSVFNGKVLNSDDIKFAYEGDTSTKEGCYEAALWYVLTNLI